MAGNANKIDAPYPRGGLFCIESAPVDIQASKTDYVWDQQEIPEACTPVWAEKISEQVTIANGITADVLDDEGTPQQIIQDEAITAIAAGAGATARCTIDDTGPLLAGG